MASGSDSVPHGRSEIKLHVTAADYGPLNTIEGGHNNNFRSGSYYVTTPKNDFILLHRLHGGPARSDGQYWTAERREGRESYRFDYAVRENWNSLQNETTLLVPKGVYMYEGPVSAQGHYLGGGWQVFIPKDVLKPLIEHQKLLVSGGATPGGLQGAIEKVNKAQSKMLSTWGKERYKAITSQTKNLVTRGSYAHKLPQTLRDALHNGGTSRDVQLQPGTYRVHQEVIRNLDGSTHTATLSVRVEFVRTTTRTYQSGNTMVTEHTHHYNIIYEWR